MEYEIVVILFGILTNYAYFYYVIKIKSYEYI
jgi:hypothetical protein